MRRAFLNRVNEMIEKEKDTVFFTVDIGMWAIKESMEKYPERCKNAGIFEDGMMSIAAGMAKAGLIPVIFGIQPYLIERALEQIKLDLAYQKFGANIIGTGASIDYSKYGYSHYCAEDLHIIKAIPGCEFIAPGTKKQFLQLFNQTYRNNHPTFFRISDYPNKIYDPDVEFNKAVVIKEGKTATVITVSVMLDDVMEVCKDKDVTVLYYTTLEPFDYQTLSKYYNEGNILVVSPQFEGSLTFDVVKAFEGKPVNILEVSFKREIFRNYGTCEEKMNYYGLTKENIRLKLDKLTETKNGIICR